MKKLFKKIKSRIKNRIRSTGKYIKYKIVVPRMYRRYCRLPKNDKLVLFADLRSRDTHENFVGLMELCKEK